LFFAGHLALVFIINKAARTSERYRRISENLSVVFLFIAAIIPDLDFVFYGFIEHHTITHSLTFWSIAYLPLFLRWRMKILPYFIATLSHLLGDLLMGKPPVLYGIWSEGYGPYYDYATAYLAPSEFMLARSLLDLSVVLVFLIIYKRSIAGQRILKSDRDVFVGLPILGVLVTAIFIASSIQGKLFSLGRENEWPVLITAYSILAIAHLLITLTIFREARMFLKNKKSESIRI